MTEAHDNSQVQPAQAGFQFTLLIQGDLAGRTVRSILQSKLQLSRRMLRHLITTNGVLRNGQPVYQTARVVEGDIINIMLPLEETDLVPLQTSVDLQYEDGEIVVVNKPAGQLTHPTAREREGSLLAAVYNVIQPAVPHCIHRLDRDTSGLVMLAKHGHFHHLFDDVLRQGHIHRAYCALVHLDDEEPQMGWQTIDLPIAQDERAPSRRVISATGQRATTHYRVLANLGGVGLVFVVLETGRTHQIRLHFSAVGQPLIGDTTYGLRHRNQEVSYQPTLDHQALHGTFLRFRQPVSGATQSVYASPPADLLRAWNSLGGSPCDWPNLEKCAELFMNCPIFANIQV